MKSDRLQQLLKELHQELGATETLDPESRSLIEKVLHDVDRIEQHPEPPARIETQLRDVVLRFESKHPRLATTVRQLADALGKLGI